MSASLFAVIQEALETLGSEAGNQDDITGMEIANEGIQALGTIRSLLRDVAPTLRDRHEDCIAEGKENCAYARLVSEVLDG
jgi:hypothetical protein